MAIFELPTRQDTANYINEVDLDDVTFRLSYKYNSRDDAWYMTVVAGDGTTLRAGVKVVSNWDLLRLWRDTTERPAGDVLTLNRATTVSAPALEQLGVDTLLLYSGDA